MWLYKHWKKSNKEEYEKNRFKPFKSDNDHKYWLDVIDSAESEIHIRNPKKDVSHPLLLV